MMRPPLHPARSSGTSRRGEEIRNQSHECPSAQGRESAPRSTRHVSSQGPTAPSSSHGIPRARTRCAVIPRRGAARAVAGGLLTILSAAGDRQRCDRDDGAEFEARRTYCSSPYFQTYAIEARRRLRARAHRPRRVQSVAVPGCTRPSPFSLIVQSEIAAPGRHADSGGVQRVAWVAPGLDEHQQILIPLLGDPVAACESLPSPGFASPNSPWHAVQDAMNCSRPC